MTMKELFKKVEGYNEIAQIIGTYKAEIELFEKDNGITLGHEHFDSYEMFRKYIKAEYVKEVADKLIKADCWMFDEEITFDWAGGTANFIVELVTA